MDTNSIAQTNLREPQQVDWDSYSSGSKYVAPPPAIGPDGKLITYYGVVVDANETKPDDDYLQYLLDPIRVVKSGSADGTTLRFTRVSTKPFLKDGAPMKGNPNKLANYLRACGLQAKPQSNSEYRACVKATLGKVFPFTIDWEAYNKDTQETVRGYNNFPDDPDRPGQKKSILKPGDIVTERDSKGNVIGTKAIQSEVLFANARLKYFQDATPRVTGGR